MVTMVYKVYGHVLNEFLLFDCGRFKWKRVTTVFMDGKISIITHIFMNARLQVPFGSIRVYTTILTHHGIYLLVLRDMVR